MAISLHPFPRTSRFSRSLLVKAVLVLTSVMLAASLVSSAASSAEKAKAKAKTKTVLSEKLPWGKGSKIVLTIPSDWNDPGEWTDLKVTAPKSKPFFIKD